MAKTANGALVKNLMEFGLGNKEARIYLALLELEVAIVSEIAKASGINRSSTYVVLESLKEKGLVSTSEDQNVQQYMAVSPDLLLLEAQHKAVKADEIKNNIHDIVPELKALHKDTKQKPKVQVFEGKAGLISVLEGTLHNKEKLIRLASLREGIAKALPDYFGEYTKKRNKLGIKVCAIYPEEKGENGKIAESSKLDTSILISPKKYPFSADMAIYGDKISYISLDKKGSCITIESKEIADVMKNIFDLAYQEAKRLSTISDLVVDYKKSLAK